MRVLVTGATGFLGFRIAEKLTQQGLRVRALVRATSLTKQLEKLPVEIVQGSLNPPKNLAAILRGVDALIHSAGGGRYRGKKSFYENNTRTTQNLLEAWQTIGCRNRKFILISSQAATGPALSAEHFPNGEEARPQSLYGQSKLAAEELVLALKDEISLVILRPPALYGPGDRRFLPLFKAAERGSIPMPGAGQTMSFLHVDDCVNAVCLALQEDPKGNHIYTINDGQTYSLQQIVDILGQVMGHQPRLLRLPSNLLLAIGFCSEWWSCVRGKAVRLSRDKVRDMVGAYWQSDAQSFVADYHWKVEYDFALGAAQTALWYRQNGWLRKGDLEKGN